MLHIFFGNTISNEGVHSFTCKIYSKRHYLEEMTPPSIKTISSDIACLAFYRLKVAPGLWLLLESLSKSISFLTW